MDDYANINSCFWREVEGIAVNYMQLEGLDLKITLAEVRFRERVDFVSYKMDDFLSNLPQTLKSLSLSIHGVELQGGNRISLGNLRHLRSLKFLRCTHLATKFFKCLAAWFTDENIQLDVLEILECRKPKGMGHIREEAVAKIFRNAGVLQT